MKNVEIIFKESPASVIFRKAETTLEVPALWLREKTPDADSIDTQTQQRLFDSHLIDPEIALIKLEKVNSSSAWLTFSDGHQALYTESEILDNALDLDPVPSAESWKSDINVKLVRHNWTELNDDAKFQASLIAYLKYGFIILTNVPNNAEQVLAVGSKFGYVKETNFGKYFEVYSKPSANDLAYRSVRLGPHTDNPYRDPVPGIQLLHCLINETSGGLSTLVDSVSVVEALKREDYEGYKLLKDTSVRFRFVDKGVELTSRRPMISVDDAGNTLGVHYSPRLDSLPLLEDAKVKAFHRARKRLAELFNHEDYELKFRLGAGELMLFDNSRVLHGRTSYDPSEGHRHLQGCYIDFDGPRERFSEVMKRLRMLEVAA
jgi:gamma-butyrobetaine dioxygenase